MAYFNIRISAFFFLFLLLSTFALSQERFSETAALKIAQTYLNSEDPAVKDKAMKELAGFSGNIFDIIDKLHPVPGNDFKQGFSGTKYFSVPRLMKKYAEEQLYYFVPSSYNPEKPTGLLIFLSDCDSTSLREAAEAELSNYIAWGDYIKSNPYIAVAPSLPTNFRQLWASEGNAEYISAVIEETSSRYKINPDRIVLAGHSAGASGAYSLAFRMPDRFSIILAHSGNWKAGNWNVLNGTPLYIIHGEKDAVPPENPWREHRPKITDVGYARLADSLLTSGNIEHKYEENDYGHYQYEAFGEVSAFFEYMQKMERDPYNNHVIAATPADGVYQSQYNRWITILGTGTGSIQIDTVEPSGRMSPDESAGEFNRSGIIHSSKRVRGGIVDAMNMGNNVFVINTTNVKSFELWLNPAMADFTRPVTVVLNDREIILNARESIVTALQSYERRRDWGMIYTAKITLRP